MDAPKTPVGKMIDQLASIRDKKRKADAVVKEFEEQYKLLEAQILQEMAAQGLDKGSGKTATASLGEEVVADLQDWDKFTAWLAKTKHFHIFQRRFSNPAYRELVALSKGRGIPGLVSFTKTKLNLRSLKGE